MPTSQTPQPGVDWKYALFILFFSLGVLLMLIRMSPAAPPASNNFIDFTEPSEGAP